MKYFATIRSKKIIQNKLYECIWIKYSTWNKIERLKKLLNKLIFPNKLSKKVNQKYVTWNKVDQLLKIKTKLILVNNLYKKKINKSTLNKIKQFYKHNEDKRSY